ncbi:hypothetical protein [Thiobacillus sedimenti]|uniref:Uncharacterized protein n=1 Tax=Thiobacillus sedimenti TaxID=3110231 RepID=A0ABZ1CIZ9_9PROT|nr:hypothetical protein [Thiobacillus sp. SCUT-2]WRS39377.1 hypothetical protein VA613_00480 [Thiobacillus sp. SCUT-2]
MALLNDQLSVWEIGFRWAGHDPEGLWVRLPLAVRDNFRVLLSAVLEAHLASDSLSLEKYDGDNREEASLHIRYWLDEVYACISGKRFDRRLLKHAFIGRFDFLDWCERRGAPPPEFWFPPGWRVSYKWPSDDGVEEEGGQSVSGSSELDDKVTPKGLRPGQRACIAAQQIASAIWKDEPTRTIASMCKDELILKYGGGAHYEEDTVRSWVRAVAPPEVSQRRGRPPKKTPVEDD